MRNCWGCGKPFESEKTEYRCPPCQEKFEKGVAKYNKKVDDGKVKPYFWIGGAAYKPYLTVILLFVNSVIMILMYLDGYTHDPLETAFKYGAQYTDSILYYGEWWRLASSWFVHFGIRHFAMNMLALWIIGSTVEGELGSIKFAAAYILSGLGGSLATLYFGSDFAVSAGASGAICGIFGFAYMYAHVRRTYIGTLDSRALMIWIIISQAYGFIMPNIGWIAHLGGLITGGLFGFIIAKTRKGDFK
ncbi:MAG: rhomboid family intramembrane serine protease [Defluviitaleaceae bacterium]|nr:rhomboid family intramembrane serine protease [Defluviitaleaceae bacterium]